MRFHKNAGWCLVGLAIGVSTMGATLPSGVGPGEHVLQVEDERIWLIARDAPLGVVIKEVEQALGVRVRVTDKDSDTVSGTYRGVTLDRLLTGAGVNYILFYTQTPDANAPRLIGGGLSRPGDPSLIPKTIPPDAQEVEPDPDPQSSPLHYTVVEGDTLQEISMMFIVSLPELAAVNGMKPDTQLRVGQTLTMPSQPIRYVVQQGDTLQHIAKLLIISITELAAYNELPVDVQVLVGQVILVPPRPDH